MKKYLMSDEEEELKEPMGRRRSEQAIPEPDNSKKKKKSKASRKGGRLFVLALELFALVGLFVGYMLLSKWDLIQHVEVQPKVDVYGQEIQIFNEDEMESEYVEKISKGYYNFVVFGCDSTKNGINDRGTSVVKGCNTDVIMIVSVNKDTGDTRIASVYRDTVMYMPDDGTYNKINYAAARWDVSSTMVALNQNLDLTLTDYVSVNWEAVALCINLLGGVDVDVPENMLGYINGYITETVAGTQIGSVHLTHSGPQTLDGVQAVAYCRVRYTDNDYMRTERQREVVKKMIEKAKQAGPGQLMGIADAVFKETATTFELSEIFEMCSLVESINLTDTTGYPFYKLSQQHNDGTPHVSWPVYAMSSAINVGQLHEFLYDETDYKLTPTANKISMELENLTGVTAPAATTAVHPAGEE